MIARLGDMIARAFRAVVPDPFVIAVILTFVTAGLALWLGEWGDRSVGERCLALVDSWRSEKGIWAFLAFSMQMCLVLVTGHALAESPPMRRVLTRVAAMPRNSAQAAALVAAVACTLSILNWGLGLIAGAILARNVGRAFARRGQSLNYPLIAAAGYTGFLVWHGGLSGSAPLAMTTVQGATKIIPAELLDRMGGPIGLDRTIFSKLNLVVEGGLLVIVPVVLALLAGRRSDTHEFAAIPEVAEMERAAEPVRDTTVPDALDRSFAVVLALVALVAISVWRFLSTSSLTTIGINEVNGVMFGVGLLLHGSVRSYLAASERGAAGCAGIILQFPLYGGIVSMVMVSGLAKVMATTIVSSADPGAIPILTFIAACVVNFFVPSGGGQWGVQGPIAIETALGADVDVATMVMAVAYGDQVTNMLQPFWALPLLAVTGVRARDIVGYTAIAMVVGGAWIALMLWVLA